MGDQTNGDVPGRGLGEGPPTAVVEVPDDSQESVVRRHQLVQHLFDSEVAHGGDHQARGGGGIEAGEHARRRPREPASTEAVQKALTPTMWAATS